LAERYDTLAHEWFEEVWNAGDESAVDRLFAADGRAHGLTDEWGVEIVGPAGFKPFFRKYKAAFPDLRMEVAQTVSEGDLIAVRFIVRGTHRGDSIGIMATNRPVEFQGMCILRLSGGQIVEAWNITDTRALFNQLATDG